jgi:phosphoglycerate dehydrogenase-like enzyme
MTTGPLKVYVIQGRGQRAYADCQTALDRVPARLESLPFIGDAEELILRARDADALIVSSSPVTRRVMEALDGLKVVMRTGVGYDVIDVPAATELGVVVINVPDICPRPGHRLTPRRDRRDRRARQYRERLRAAGGGARDAGHRL